MLSQLETESKTWIKTEEEVDEFISPSFFEKPSTTGIVTRSSNLWRYMPVTIDINRKMSREMLDKLSPKFDDSAKNDQTVITKQLLVEEFLRPLIKTGEQRQNYKQLVKEFSSNLSGLDAFKAVDWYFQVLYIIVRNNISRFYMENFQ